MNHQCMVMKYLKLYFQSVARNVDLSEVILMLLLVFSFEYVGCRFRETQDPLEFSKIPIRLVYVASVNRAHANLTSCDKQKHKIVKENSKMVALEMNVERMTHSSCFAYMLYKLTILLTDNL
jgi:hypothetical protein